MKISGEAFEFVSKLRIFPTLEAQRERVFANPVGFQTIEVAYRIWVEPTERRIIKLITSMEKLESLFSRIAFNAIANREHWKYPTAGAFVTEDMNTALLLAHAVTYMVGGAWIIKSKHENWSDRDVFYLWSKGYFHYIGP